MSIDGFRDSLSRRMSKRFRVIQGGRANAEIEVSVLLKRIVQLEREQKADASLIDAAIRKAESEIADLGQRRLAANALSSAIATIRDRTALLIRDVRSNMHRRTIAAREMQQALGSDFLSGHTRFAGEDATDATLRTRFFELLQRTPTSALLLHLQDAIENGNFACAESIRFEFRCRSDRYLYWASFEAIREMRRDDDPAEMQIRLESIANATAKIDSRVASLAQRTPS